MYLEKAAFWDTCLHDIFFISATRSLAMGHGNTLYMQVNYLQNSKAWIIWETVVKFDDLKTSAWGFYFRHIKQIVL